MEHSQRHTDAITRTHIMRILQDYAPTLLKLNDATITFNKVQLKLAPSHRGPHILISYTKTTSYYGAPRTYELIARIFLDTTPNQYTRTELIARILLATTPQDLANLSDVNPYFRYIF